MLGERGINPLEDKVKHLHQLFLSKRPKEDDFVKTVEELGTELTTVNELVGKLLFELLKLIAMLDIFADAVGPSVARSNDNCITEAHLTVLNIAQDPLIQQLQQGC